MADSSIRELQLTKPGFNPTFEDVIDARHILTQVGVGKNIVLPMELALMILDLADYEPCQSSSRQSTAKYGANQFWRAGPAASVAGLYLAVSALPVPDTAARAKSITFQMSSADQGLGGDSASDTYDNSDTWFEASLLRPRSEASTLFTLLEGPEERRQNFPSPLEARDALRNRGFDMVECDGAVAWKVHKNRTCAKEYKNHRVEWVAGVPTEVANPKAMGDGRGFLENMRPGDIVALWARAEISFGKGSRGRPAFLNQQRSRTNNVREATIEIQYEVL